MPLQTIWTEHLAVGLMKPRPKDSFGMVPIGTKKRSPIVSEPGAVATGSYAVVEKNPVATAPGSDKKNPVTTVPGSDKKNPVATANGSPCRVRRRLSIPSRSALPGTPKKDAA